jgi:hypothetical protein
MGFCPISTFSIVPFIPAEEQPRDPLSLRDKRVQTLQPQ